MKTLVYILPEYCDHDFFTGWHLYERERADGKRNSDGDWGWLRDSLQIEPVRYLCVDIGERHMPAVKHYPGAGDCQKFVDEFARRFPYGLRAWRDQYGNYTAAPLNFDTHPDRAVIYKESRLYFVWRRGKGYALLAADLDDAERQAQWMFDVPKTENRLTLNLNAS